MLFPGPQELSDNFHLGQDGPPHDLRNDIGRDNLLAEEEWCRKQGKRREDTFFNGPKTAHISTAEPYCPQLRKLAIKSSQKLKIPFHKKGTAVVIEGPRFSTGAESNFFAKIAEVINMTQYPEVVLARELEICYLNISLITDYDVGLKARRDIKPVTGQEVLKIFKQNNEKVKKLILEIIKNIPETRSCSCKDALKQAFVS